VHPINVQWYYREGARSQGSNPQQTPVMVYGISRSSRIILWRWSPISGIHCPAV
jgi:hypothetical protein